MNMEIDHAMDLDDDDNGLSVTSEINDNSHSNNHIHSDGSSNDGSHHRRQQHDDRSSYLYTPHQPRRRSASYESSNVSYGYGSEDDNDNDDGNMIDAVVDDMGYGFDNNNNNNNNTNNNGNNEDDNDDEEEDLGYEACAPMPRRGSMTLQEEKQRRASIQAVMADTALSPLSKRKSIQYIMDGRRNSITATGRRNSTNGGGSTGRRNSMSGMIGGGGGTNSSPFNMNHNHSNTNNNIFGGGNVRQRRFSMNGVLCNTSGGSHSIPSTASLTSGDTTSCELTDYGYGEEVIDQQQHHQSSSGLLPLPPFCLPVDDNRNRITTQQNNNNNNNNNKYFAFSNEQTRRAEMTRPPCNHYDRNCTIIAACCGAAFGCRICHDDSPDLPPKINHEAGRRQRYHRSASLPSSYVSMDEEDTNHTIDRFATAEVLCRSCFTRQSSKTNQCVNCHIQFGEYHCNICNLWMSNEERPYHCKDCGFCRVGGSENFKHCNTCGMCIDATLIDTHNCRAGKYRSNCPVCQEYLFSSRGASHEMPCGHAIHWECFRQLAAHDSRCPICKKTAETRERMMPTWNAMASSIAMQPIPPELARVVCLTCNDCEKSEDARAWHFLGMQCSHCQSFNTVVDKILLSGIEAHEFLETNAQMRHYHAQQQQMASEGDDGTDGAAPSSEVNEPRGRRRMNRRRSAF